MSQEVRGIIATAKGEPVSMETIVIPDPGPGEAVVAIQACGVCHTDLHYREGGINDEFPFLLGHEAAGLVESVGEGVTNVVPGDFVILNWCVATVEPANVAKRSTASTPTTRSKR
jgi:S-(hydroxymethyl)mycothiol dehydrogenase